MQFSDDPRVRQTRAQILGAARELLSEVGPAAVTFATVAARAGVGRATLYRHWADADALLDDVLDEFTFPYFAHPETPLAGWLAGELDALARDLATPAVARFIASLTLRAAGGDQSAIRRRDALFEVLEHRIASACGLEDTADMVRLVAGPIGSLLYRGLFRSQLVSDVEVQAIAAQLAALGNN